MREHRSFFVGVHHKFAEGGVESISQKEIEWVKAGLVHLFYTCSAWLRIRNEVMSEDKHECQKCKRRHKYTKATLVHHEKPIRDYPELALSKYYIDEYGQRQRQLVSLCDACHEEEHPERFKHKRAKPLTVERWD